MEIKVPESEGWLVRRHEVWLEYESVFQRGIEGGNLDADILEARKKWFVAGDLSPLIELAVRREIEYKELVIGRVIELCPMSSIASFSEFLREFCSLLSERELGWWVHPPEKRNDGDAVSFFLNMFVGPIRAEAEEVHRYFLLELLPKNGMVTFPFPLGNDAWVPRSEVNVANLVRKILIKLYSYLYVEDDFSSYAHLKVALPFVRDNLFLIDKKVYALSYIKRAHYSKSGEYLTSAGQRFLRELIGALHGYDLQNPSCSKKIKCNDLEVEAELKDIFNSTKMPKAYHTLVEYIKEHKEKSLATGL